MFFFFNDTATTEIYTLSLHDALPIYRPRLLAAGTPPEFFAAAERGRSLVGIAAYAVAAGSAAWEPLLDRKSTRLNSSHANISYAVFCLKKKNYLRFPTHISWTRSLPA